MFYVYQKICQTFYAQVSISHVIIYRKKKKNCMISTVDGNSRWNNSIKLISANVKFKINYLNCKLTHILIKIGGK